MYNKIVIPVQIALLVFAMFIASCDKSRNLTHKSIAEKHQPFPGLSISIKTDFDRTFMGDMKNFRCIATLTSTDKNYYHIEFWDVRYRHHDVKVNEITIEKPGIHVTNYERDHPITHYRPFYRIECYTYKDGKIKHQTISYKCKGHYIKIEK